mgnify:CR=1 FL=1
MKYKKRYYGELSNYGYNIFSQNGEDGIIEEINKRLNLEENKETRWCVEFGAWDGIYLSNTFNLIKKGWNGIYIEGDQKRFKDLQKTQKSYKSIIPINAFVSKQYSSKNSLDNILRNTDIPVEFEILSIDIDSFDLEVWESLKEYQPKIVIIEINSNYPPGILKWHSNEFRNTNGNSFSATLKVAKDKGYELVVHTGNMIFIRRDLISMIRLEEKYLKYPELLFNELWYSLDKGNFLMKILRRSEAFLKNKLLKKINFLK